MLQHESPWPWQGEGPAHPGYPLIVASPITPLQAYPMAMACPGSLVAAHWLPSTARPPASQARCRLRVDWVVVAIALIVMAAMAWVFAMGVAGTEGTGEGCVSGVQPGAWWVIPGWVQVEEGFPLRSARHFRWWRTPKGKVAQWWKQDNIYLCKLFLSTVLQDKQGQPETENLPTANLDFPPTPFYHCL